MKHEADIDNTVDIYIETLEQRIKELETAIEKSLQERSDYFIHLILKEVMKDDL